MSGFSNYEELMAHWSVAYMMPVIESEQKSTLAEPSKHNFFNTTFYGFTEISEAFASLRLTETLISLAPPRSKCINNDEYIKYLINNYLQEVYILKERLQSYATKLKRLHERAGRKALVIQHIEPLFELVKSSLNEIVKTRGLHVHSIRYTDYELNNVTQLALISKFDSEYKPHYKFSYKKAQNVWSLRIKDNNLDTAKLLDYYFDSILNVVKDDSGGVFMP